MRCLFRLANKSKVCQRRYSPQPYERGCGQAVRHKALGLCGWPELPTHSRASCWRPGLSGLFLHSRKSRVLGSALCQLA